jgi:hypothetical protein
LGDACHNYLPFSREDYLWSDYPLLYVPGFKPAKPICLENSRVETLD